MKTLLKVHATGGTPAEYAASVLQRMSDAYKGMWFIKHTHVLNKTTFEEHGNNQSITDNRGSLMVPISMYKIESLTLEKAALQPSGFYLFSGKFAPLAAIKQYLNERYERIKDSSYRQQYGVERLSIEHKISKIALINVVYKKAIQAGVSEFELNAIIRDNAIIPLLKLDSLQDKSIISYAEITKEKVEENTLEE